MKLSKITSAIFLAIVLVTGTITAMSFPSFIIKGMEAQAQPYYSSDRMDNSYNSYGPPAYEMDNNDRKSYDKRSYGNDYGYKSQYQPSYKPDYNKPQYTSYGKDNSKDKSKDSSKSVDINKLNCINTNININGNNTGNINIGNKGQVVPTGDLDASSYSGGEYGSDGYNNGYYEGFKKDKGFTCIINNNNTNTNIGGGGNVTDGNGNDTDTCEECFVQVLNGTELWRLQAALGNGINVTITIGTPQVEINSLEELCNVLENLTGTQLVSVVIQVLRAAGITLTAGELLELVTCIGTALGITILPTIPTRSLEPFDIHDGGTGDSPIISQGTGDSPELTALEKIAMLKQQWLDLLP